MPLTDQRGLFHLVAFDLDLTHGDGNVIRDTDQLTGWLDQLRIEHTVAQSGPSGGRHVWLSLTEPATAELVSTLADHAAAALPTLDLSALKNAAWGSMRPPGAPHRSGGHSAVLSGPDEALRPAVTVEQLIRLTITIAAAAAARQPQPDSLPASTRLPVDAEGHRYLPGRRQALPPGSDLALRTVPADASAAAFTVLLGAVRARWHLTDVLAVLDQPGLEHIRSERHTGGRELRSPSDRQRVLARQWNRAVEAIHSTPDTVTSDDSTFLGRAAAVTEQIRATQVRADSAVGRWTSRTGPAARRVLDALCLLALTAVTATIEADTRRLALLTGLGRETVRVRLHQLAGDGWISLTEPATGRRGHLWTITRVPASPGQIGYPQTSLETRSQGVPPPAPTRTHWQQRLRNRLADQAHDVFTAAGLGHAAGQLYAALSSATPTNTKELATLTRRLPEHVNALLADLLATHLVIRTATGWRRSRPDRRAAAALRLGIHGTLTARRGRYEHERALWAWWCDELDWMRLPSTDPAKRRRGRIAVGQLAIDSTRPRGRYPRDPGGRADHRMAADIAA